MANKLARGTYLAPFQLACLVAIGAEVVKLVDIWASAAMSQFAEIVRIVVPIVVIPAAVFAGNWAIRYKQNYSQTAAADFILAVLIFDGAVITTAREFEPFVRDHVLRQITVHWHIVLAVAGCASWWAISTFAEPVVAGYYAAKRNRPPRPIWTLMICWMGVFMLVSAHIGFFVWSGGTGS